MIKSSTYLTLSNLLRQYKFSTYTLRGSSELEPSELLT